jgi:hypothetical protein
MVHVSNRPAINTSTCRIATSFLLARRLRVVALEDGRLALRATSISSVAGLKVFRTVSIVVLRDAFASPQPSHCAGLDEIRA